MAKSPKDSLFANFSSQEKRDLADVLAGRQHPQKGPKAGYLLGLMVKLVKTMAVRGELDEESQRAATPIRNEQLPAGISPTTLQGTPRRVVTLPMADTGRRRFPIDHPIITGKPVKAESSNVYSYWYHYDSATLYVRFWEVAHEGKWKGTHQAGAVYSYANVTPEEFITLYNADSKGKWVWDRLRVRGTVSGHRKDYRLVAVSGSGYVPRKATFMSGPHGPGEYFVQRRMKVRGTNVWLSSQRPDVLVSAYERRPNRGEPNRGEPRRG